MNLFKLVLNTLAGVALYAGTFNYLELSKTCYSRYNFKGYIGENYIEFGTKKRIFGENTNYLILDDNKTLTLFIDNKNNDLLIDKIKIIEQGKIREISNFDELSIEEAIIIINRQFDFNESLEKILETKYPYPKRKINSSSKRVIPS